MTQAHEYYERYMAGEHVTVWRELIALGEKIREEPLRSVSLRVCREIVRRARFNLGTLYHRLLELGYQFAEPAAALVDASPGAIEKILATEQELGVLPLVGRVWYETFDSVNFRQAGQQLRIYTQGIRPPAGPDIFGLGSHPVIVFQSLDRCKQQLQQMDAEHEEYVRQLTETGNEEFADLAAAGPFLPFGGCASNCEEKGFSLPCYGIDGVIYNDGGGDIYFVDELRSAFQWGGFPFWKWAIQKADFYSPFEYRPNFEKLLPVLKEGLLEL